MGLPLKIAMPRRVQSGDRALNSVQDATADALRPVLSFEELNGSRMDEVTLTTTAQTLAHGLGRTPIGWRVIDKIDAGDPYRTAWDERTISLRVASGTCRVTLWVW
jgi:hypothetical protein